MSEELLQIKTPREQRRWRSLAEWFGAAPDEGEFPAGAALPPEAPSRRDFLQLVGASVALAGCARDLPEKILPYSVRPAEVTPGVASFYATSMVIDGVATG